ncbi:MAG: bifunctional DNA-binding transcriptional regulator/O6-methylguanine-DNA methyltransferase Ada [Thermomicrobiales bacterium]|nr:bifunctional DNA-binding transcriptional regulator/O6-methylguanine-DNA methyltransferase Ada [Thermomicrobiales bacterium]
MQTMTHDTNTIPAIDDERWQAVLRRDGNRDGEFVFAVDSTGIYCRPSCPARRPRPEHVRFFSSPSAAERAGYRACRRCRPHATTTLREDLAARAAAWIDEHLDERQTLARMGEALGVSPGHLQRSFTRAMGVSPRAYAAARRLETAKAEMRAGADVTSALHTAGYGSSSRFYEQANSALGMPPSSYRRGGEGMTIRFGTAASAMGRVLVAATELGICAASIGDNDGALEAALRSEFPRAAIARDDEAVRDWLDAMLEHLRQRRGIVALPLDVMGTPFQRSVWRALRAIPEGERRSYAEVAAEIGKPSAARAVAAACAANPVALVIPCHRVVRGDGGLGGYRWGVERKRALLNAEERAP